MLELLITKIRSNFLFAFPFFSRCFGCYCDWQERERIFSFDSAFLCVCVNNFYLAGLYFLEFYDLHYDLFFLFNLYHFFSFKFNVPVFLGLIFVLHAFSIFGVNGKRVRELGERHRDGDEWWERQKEKLNIHRMRKAEKSDGKRAYYWKAENNWIQRNEVRKDMQQQQTATTTME